MTKQILVIPPVFDAGNVGDAAIVKACTHILNSYNIKHYVIVSEDDKIDIDKFACCICFGNDIIAYYGGLRCKTIIDNFLQSNKNVFVLNTSWGERVPDTLKNYRNHPHFHTYIRDEKSLELINKQMSFKNPPILCADLAHLCPSDSYITDKNLMKWIGSSQKKIIGINCHSDFKSHSSNVAQNYTKILNAYKDEFRFMFIPHDSRKPEKKLLEKLIKESEINDYFLTEYLTPQQEKIITKYLHILISGRMHLAILTIVNSVPCILMEYNGVKASGTMRHWGLEKLVLNPANADNLINIFQDVLLNHNYYTTQIKNNKNLVESLSMKPIKDIIQHLHLNSV